MNEKDSTLKSEQLSYLLNENKAFENKKEATFDIPEIYVIEIEKVRNTKYYFENTDDSEKIQVSHFIMVKEGKEPGNHYNNLALELIGQQYSNFNKRKAMKIKNEIINIFSQLYLIL